MTLSELRTYILSSQYEFENARKLYGLTKDYTITQILAIILERTLDVGMRLEALADLDIE